jgi:Zn-dependent protease
MHHNPSEGNITLNIQSMLVSLPGVIIGLTIHEYAHAFAAWRLGDATAKEQGRLTLNPLRHIDPLGFLLLIVAGFGWAKPVSFDKTRLSRPRRDEAIIAAAGPLSNLFLALLISVAIRILLLVIPYTEGGPYATLLDALLHVVYINYGLMVFNLIPIPPLDGSHVLFTMIHIAPETEARLYKYGTIALFAVIIIGNRTNLDLLPIGRVVDFIAETVFRVLGF